jgi:hypothetical protein
MKRYGVMMACLLAGCGYETGRVYAVDQVAVPIFGNDSDRRINEFELTEAVVRQMQTAGLTVNPENPRHRLRGRILKIDQARLAEDRDSNVIVGSFGLALEIRVIDETTGRVVVEPTVRRFAAAFAASRGQSLETARAQVFDEAGDWVLEQLERAW